MKTETHSLAWIAQTIGPHIGPVGVCANPHCSVGSLVELHEDGLCSWCKFLKRHPDWTLPRKGP